MNQQQNDTTIEAVHAEQNMTMARWGFGALTIAVMTLLLGVTYCGTRPSDARICMERGGSWMPVMTSSDGGYKGAPSYEQSCVMPRDRALVPRPVAVK